MIRLLGLHFSTKAILHLTDFCVTFTQQTFRSGLETFQQLLSEGHPSPKATLQKMASTGVTVNDEVIAQFNDVKLGRVKLKFIIYKIDNGVIVTESVGLSESFDDFIAMMPADDCRYSMYDMNFTTNDGRPGNKLVFISW